MCPFCVLYMCTHHCTHTCTCTRTHCAYCACMHVCTFVHCLHYTCMHKYVPIVYCAYAYVCIHLSIVYIIHACMCLPIECAVHTCMFIACTEHVCIHIGVCLVYWDVYTRSCTFYTSECGFMCVLPPLYFSGSTTDLDRKGRHLLPALGPTELPSSVRCPSASTRSAPQRHISQALCIRCKD